MNTALTTFLNVALGVCVLCGFCSWFCLVYGAIRLNPAQRHLLQTLKESAPDVYQRLHSPMLRSGIKPWDLAAFLRSDELDDQPNFHEIKNKCRHAWVWFVRGLFGFVGSWFFGFLLGAIAAALGSSGV